MDNKALVKWLVKRFFLLKKELYALFDRIIYQKQSHFLLHYWNAHRCPFQAILFYNYFGRILFATREFIALVSHEKVFKKSIKLDGFDEDITLQKFQEKGHHDSLWPKSPFLDDKYVLISDDYFKKIQNTYMLSISIYHDSLDKTEDWEVVREKFKVLLLDEKGNLNKNALINFRENHSFEKVIADTFKQVDTSESYMSAYLKGIDLVLEYHRSAKKVKKEILASLSESYAGNSTCVHYRGQRLSEKLLFYAVATDDVLSNVPFNEEKRTVILDIGTGYGALPAILKKYVSNSCHILVDLPEVTVFAMYYIKYHFPDKKIALLEDIIKKTDDLETFISTYDFIILPSTAVKLIPENCVDLVLNTASLGFLSKEYLDYYIGHINRVLKTGGYFYSINKTETCKWGVGMYEWDLKEEYVTLLLEYNNRFSYPQWLGKKID